MMLWIFILALSCQLSRGDRILDKLYWNVDERGYSMCVMRLNSTGVIGCSSNQKGDVGTIYLKLDNDTREIKLESDDAPYIIVMGLNHFINPDVTTKLNNDPKVAGILVIEPKNKTERPSEFSADSKCPNAYHSMYGPQQQCSKTKWNSPGTDYFFMRWSFPIVLLHNDQNATLKRIVECYLKHNVDRPDDRRCAMQLKTKMNGAVNSKICLQREYYDGLIMKLGSYCGKLRGHSIHLINKPPSDKAKQKKVVLVLARLDAFSFFIDQSFGTKAVSPAVVCLLAIAKALTEITNDPDKQLIISLLNGESMQYLGSARLVYDMKKKTFLKSILGYPIEGKDIESVIELNQLGDGVLNKQFYLHTMTNSKQTALDSDWVSKFQTNAGGQTFAQVKDEILPPSSVQTLLMSGFNNFSYVLVSDYQKEYKNLYYHSMMDDEILPKENMYTFANSLYKTLASVVYPGVSVSLNDGNFSRILGCYQSISECDLLEEALPMNTQRTELGKKTTLPDMNYRTRNSYFVMITTYLSYFLSGTLVSGVTNQADCKQTNMTEYPAYYYRWIKGPAQENSTGICWRALIRYKNTEILTDNDAWNNFNTSKFPYWTESVWGETLVRVFLKPSTAWETTVLSSGIIVTLFTIAVMVIIVKFFDDIFPSASYLAGSNIST